VVFQVIPQGRQARGKELENLFYNHLVKGINVKDAFSIFCFFIILNQLLDLFYYLVHPSINLLMSLFDALFLDLFLPGNQLFFQILSILTQLAIQNKVSEVGIRLLKHKSANFILENGGDI